MNIDATTCELSSICRTQKQGDTHRMRKVSELNYFKILAFSKRWKVLI